MLTGYIGYRAIQVPMQGELARLQQELADAQATQDLRGEIAQSLSDLQRLQQRLPSEASSEWLLREVTQHAEEQGVQLSMIMPQDRRELRDGVQLSVTVQLSATYHQLGRFISAIERDEEFMWIEDFQISRPAGRDVLPVVRLTVSTIHVPMAKM